MPVQDYGDCNSCLWRVPARNVVRDGKVYLIKSCEECGETETLISSDAADYFRKRALDGPMITRAVPLSACHVSTPKSRKPYFRLERCAAAFAYVDPELDKVRTIPVCAWGLHKNRMPAKVTEHYGLRRKNPDLKKTRSNPSQ